MSISKKTMMHGQYPRSGLLTSQAASDSGTPRGLKSAARFTVTVNALSWRRPSIWAVLFAVTAISHSSFSFAQQPAAEKKAPSKPARVESLTALVTEVSGTVEWAKAGVSPLATKGWTAVKWKERLAAGSQIRTGLRSFVHLRFGETTYISLRSATHASIDQLYRSATTEHVRVGLGYGTVRGGSAEGKLDSDVVIDSTVATLAKRGTEGWQMSVEPVTGRFRIALAEYGLVEAIKKARGVGRSTRKVRPGEFATESNIANMWIKQDIFNRNVNFYQANSMSSADADFTSDNPRGRGVLAPGGGSTLSETASPGSSAFVLDQIGENFPGGRPATTLLLPTNAVRRPDGNFGTGSTFKIMLPVSSQRTRASVGRFGNVRRRK